MISGSERKQEKCEYGPEEGDGQRQRGKGHTCHQQLSSQVLVVVAVEPELLLAVCNKKLQELLLLLRKLPLSFSLFVRYRLRDAYVETETRYYFYGFPCSVYSRHLYCSNLQSASVAISPVWYLEATSHILQISLSASSASLSTSMV